jgi:alpha-beta hydrolase superfamily lysophospholipase
MIDNSCSLYILFLSCILSSHSMGGCIATKLFLDLQSTPNSTLWPMNGLILSSPAIAANPAVATPMLRFLARTLSHWLPKLGLDKLDYTYVKK